MLTRSKSSEIELRAIFGEHSYIFDRFIKVDSGVKKSSMIEFSDKFLFIDDSFSERLDVTSRLARQVLALDPTFALQGGVNEQF